MNDQKKFTLCAASLALALATPTLADELATGDAAAGEDAFKKCVTCHVVQDPDGNTLAGRSARTGPNLYGIPLAQAGTVEGFRYSKSLVKAGEAGLVWDQANFVAYMQDSKAFLRDVLDDKKARSKKSFKVRTEEDAINLWAYLDSLSSLPES